MSVIVPRSSLTDEHAASIREHLVMHPTEEWQPTNVFTNKEPKAPINFYHLFPNGDVAVPYRFGAALLKTVPNYHKTFPSRNFRFTAQLRESQKEIEPEALNHLATYGSTVLNVYPGFGKTCMCTYLTARLQTLSLVLFHREILGVQWKASYQKYGDARTWLVGVDSTPASLEDVDVILCMDTRVGSLPAWILDQVGCLVIDEAHCFCTPSHVDCLLATTPKYVIACTATLERSDGMHKMVQTLCGMHKITRISDKPFRVVKYHTGVCPPIVKGFGGGTNWSELRKWLSNDPVRNHLILSLVWAYTSQHKIMILTDLVAHATGLCQAIQNMGIWCDYMAGKKKSYNDSRVLVGSVSKTGTGFDEEMACADFGGERIDLAIICFSTKKATLLEQTAGRAFRADFPTIIHLVDDNPSVKRHWTTAQGWYRSRNGVIEEAWSQNQPKTRQSNPSNNTVTPSNGGRVQLKVVPPKVTSTPNPSVNHDSLSWNQRIIQRLNTKAVASTRPSNPTPTSKVTHPKTTPNPIGVGTIDINDPRFTVNRIQPVTGINTNDICVFLPKPVAPIRVPDSSHKSVHATTSSRV